MNRLRALLTFCSLLVCSHALAADDDWQITPGQRIGQITIGMERAEVLRRLGAPHREDDLQASATDEQTREFEDTLRDDWIMPLPISAHPQQDEGIFMADFVTVYMKARRVVQIEVRATRFKTKEGLSCASTGTEWSKVFPEHQKSSHRFDHPSAGGWPATRHLVSFEDAVRAGVAWRYASMGDLSPETDPDGRVEAVSVHAPGKSMIVDPDAGSRFIWKSDPLRSSSEH